MARMGAQGEAGVRLFPPALVWFTAPSSNGLCWVRGTQD